MTLVFLLGSLAFMQTSALSDFEDALAWYSEDEVNFNAINTTLAWENWKEKFTKSYSNPTEEGSRKSIWLAHWNTINEHNKNSSYSHKKRINQFSGFVLSLYIFRTFGKPNKLNKPRFNYC